MCPGTPCPCSEEGRAGLSEGPWRKASPQLPDPPPVPKAQFLKFQPPCRGVLMSPYLSKSSDGWPPVDLRACLLFLFQPQPVSFLPALQVLPPPPQPQGQKLHGQQGPGCRNGAGSSRESTIGTGRWPQSVPRFSSLHSDHPKLFQ